MQFLNIFIEICCTFGHLISYILCVLLIIKLRIDAIILCVDESSFLFQSWRFVSSDFSHFRLTLVVHSDLCLSKIISMQFQMIVEIMSVLLDLIIMAVSIHFRLSHCCIPKDTNCWLIINFIHKLISTFIQYNIWRMIFIISLTVFLYRLSILFLFYCETLWLLILSSFKKVHLKKLLLLKQMKIFPKIISGTSVSIHIKTLVICAGGSSANRIRSLITCMFFLWVFSDILNRLPIAS